MFIIYTIEPHNPKMDKCVFQNVKAAACSHQAETREFVGCMFSSSTDPLIVPALLEADVTERHTFCSKLNKLCFLPTARLGTFVRART